MVPWNTSSKTTFQKIQPETPPIAHSSSAPYARLVHSLLHRNIPSFSTSPRPRFAPPIHRLLHRVVSQSSTSFPQRYPPGCQPVDPNLLSLRGATGSRECAPDDRLRDEAIQLFVRPSFWIASRRSRSRCGDVRSIPSAERRPVIADDHARGVVAGGAGDAAAGMGAGAAMIEAL
jgi:hypothetical protein